LASEGKHFSVMFCENRSKSSNHAESMIIILALCLNARKGS